MWNPHPVIVTRREHSNYLGVVLYFHYTKITGWGVHLICKVHHRSIVWQDPQTLNSNFYTLNPGP